MKNDRRIKKTDEAIFNAIMRICATCPIPEITVTQVAKEANITRKTFYDHFPTVTDACQALLNGIIAKLAFATESDWEMARKSLSEVDERTETEIRLRLYIGNVRKFIAEDLQRVRMNSRFVSPDELGGYLLEPLINQVKNGLFGETSRFEEDDELVASFILAGTLWAYRRGLLEDSKEKFDEIEEHACKLLMGGLGSLLR